MIRVERNVRLSQSATWRHLESGGVDDSELCINRYRLRVMYAGEGDVWYFDVRRHDKSGTIRVGGRSGFDSPEAAQEAALADLARVTGMEVSVTTTYNFEYPS